MGDLVCVVHKIMKAPECCMDSNVITSQEVSIRVVIIMSLL